MKPGALPASTGTITHVINWEEVESIPVRPAYTSPARSGGGCLVPKSLDARTHACPDCGLTLDRDINAALNVLSAGMRLSDANVDGCLVRSPRSFPL